VDLDIARILRILPHRSPFVLIDRVTDLVPRQSAKAIKCVTYNEPFFPGHFPGEPIFPGMLILESMAQLMGVLVYASEPFDSTQKSMHIVGVDGAKFRKAVVPGDRMEIEIEVTRRRSNIWKCAGKAIVDGVLVAEAEILAAIADRDSP
jgi:3-hydroxyacyl-[acyl-carrier-protein] dehydratase